MDLALTILIDAATAQASGKLPINGQLSCHDHGAQKMQINTVILGRHLKSVAVDTYPQRLRLAVQGAKWKDGKQLQACCSTEEIRPRTQIGNTARDLARLIQRRLQCYASVPFECRIVQIRFLMAQFRLAGFSKGKVAWRWRPVATECR